MIKKDEGDKPKKIDDIIKINKKDIRIEKIQSKMDKIQGKVSPQLKAIVTRGLKYKEKLGANILEAYKYATEVDHLTVFEARLFLQFAYKDYSDRWIRHFLPNEAKQQQVHDRIKEVETRALNIDKAKQKKIFDKTDTDNKATYHRQGAEALGKELFEVIAEMSDSDLLDIRIINRIAEIDVRKFNDE